MKINLKYITLIIICILTSYVLGKMSVDPIQASIVEEKDGMVLVPREKFEELTGDAGYSGGDEITIDKNGKIDKTVAHTPKFFTEFKLTVRVKSETPKHSDYVLEQCDKLSKLIKTVPSVKEVEIVETLGGVDHFGMIEYYGIN